MTLPLSPFALALISPAQQGHLALVFKQIDEIFGVRRLACAAHGEVPHRNHGQIKRL